MLLFIYSLCCRAEVFAGREGLLRAGCGELFPAPRPAPARPRGTAEAPPGFWGLNLETRAGGLKSPLAARALLLPAPGYLPNKRQHPTREGLGSQGAFWMCCPHVGLVQGVLHPHARSWTLKSSLKVAKALHPILQGSQCHGETMVAGHQPSPSSPPTQTCHASPTQAVVPINHL